MSLSTRPLGWAELALLPPLLESFAPQFPDAEAFGAWRAGLEAALLDGRMGLQALWRARRWSAGCCSRAAR